MAHVHPLSLLAHELHFRRPWRVHPQTTPTHGSGRYPTIPYQTIPYPTMLYRTIPNHTQPYPTQPYPTLPYPPNHTPPNNTLHNHTSLNHALPTPPPLPNHTLLNHALPIPVLSNCPIQPYSTLPCHPNPPPTPPPFRRMPALSRGAPTRDVGGAGGAHQYSSISTV
jgi:hypothetical protein